MPGEHLIAIQLQDRDLALLRGLFESRLMTLDHAAVLHFDGKREMTKKRVQKLKVAGYLAERPRHASVASVLYLTAQALALLQERGDLTAFPKLSKNTLLKRAQVSDMTLRHELEIMSVKAAMVPAINKVIGCKVAEFSTWPLLHEFSVRKSAMDPTATGETVVKPDGFIRIHEEEPDGGLSEHTFYLEHDRSTEDQGRLGMKARAYLEHYHTGGLAQKHSRPRSEYAQFPFRVLMILQNEERRNNAAERLLSNTPPTLTQVWLTTFGEILADPLGAIWIRPRDYRDTLRGTRFEAGPRTTTAVYCRDTVRETLLGRAIAKRPLLES